MFAPRDHSAANGSLTFASPLVNIQYSIFMILILEKYFSIITGISEKAFDFPKVLQVTIILHVQWFASSNNINNSELDLHNCNNTAFEKRQKHDNYSTSVVRVQFQH